MKILFTGLPYFTSRFVKQLNSFDQKNTYVFCDTYTSKFAQLKFLYHLFTAKIVVSFNGVTSNSGSLNWAIKFKKKIILQWHGTDVLSIAKNKVNNCFKDVYINNSFSFTDASWLQEELKKENIECSILPFKTIKTSKKTNSFPSDNVLTYVAKGRETFYGINQILKLAKQHPLLIFNVIGTAGENLEYPENVKFYGWVGEKKAEELRNECPIFIRLTEHDGYALSVLEALSNGNYVLWNNPHPQCYFAEKEEDIELKFEQIRTELKENNRIRVETNIDWCRQNLNESIILKNYISKLEEIAGK